LEDEFLEYIDIKSRDLKKFDQVIFESGLDMYVLENITGRYGNFNTGNYILFSEWIYKNLLPDMTAHDDINGWILWVDPFSGRSMAISDLKEINSIMEHVKIKKETPLIPENIKRPGVWSEGFYFYHNEKKAAEFAKPALEIICDFPGQIIFTSIRDYQYFDQFGKSNKTFYLADLVYGSLY